MRNLVLGSVLAAVLAVALAACGEDAVPQVITKEVIKEVPVDRIVEKVVEKEVQVEVIKEVEVEVIKEVEVVKEVEVIKEVLAETFVTKKKNPLIGDLEGPTILPGFVPAKYSEAPMLAELVRAGKLPTVEERVGPEPLVMRPTHEIGKYGGTWHRGFIGPNDRANAVRAIWHDRMLYWNTEGTEIVPNMAKSCAASDDGKTTVFELRQGHRWSDGSPHTADDYMFWFEDMYSVKEVISAPRQQMLIEGTPVSMKKIDDTHIAWVSEKPYWLLCEHQSLTQSIGGHARQGRGGMGGFAPAHYLKQFHPKYVGQAESERLASEAGFDKNWGAHIKNKNSAYENVDLPLIAAWKITKPITEPTWEFERNAYSVWMDEEGNQLPYIDNVVMTVGESLEVLNLRAIAGEYDSMARHMDLMKLPVFLENAEKGDYSVKLDIMRHGGDAYICPNLSYEEDAEIGKWLANTDFRRALSMGIDRDKVNEVFFLGLGTPGSMAPVEGSLYSPGPDEVFRTMWSTHDLDTANQILDSIGLDKKDSDGFRMRTDGKGRLTIGMDTYLSFMSYVQLGEMLAEHWKDIGIHMEPKEYERGFQSQRRRANEHQLYIDTNWAAENAMVSTGSTVPTSGSHCNGPLYGSWFASDGKSGTKPPANMERAMSLIKKGKSLEGNARREAGKEAWRLLIDEQWRIGVVGMTPAIQGLRVVKNHLGNIAASTINSAHHDNPGLSRPEQWYFKVDPHTH